MRHNDFRLITLGRLVLLRGPAADEVPGCQRRKLALLAYLCLAKRPVARSALVEMFWGDEQEDRARHSLSNSLSFLRHVLGPDSISARRSDISLAADASVAIDVAEFRDAAEVDDYALAVELFGGPFLDGLYIPGSDTFEQWASGERTSAELVFTEACDAGCMRAASNRDWDTCAKFARRWLALSPTSTEAALHLLNSLRASRSPAGRRAAIAEYDRLCVQLKREYATTPSRAVVALAEKISERAALAGDAEAPSDEAGATDATEPQASSEPVVAPPPAHHQDQSNTDSAVTAGVPSEDLRAPVAVSRRRSTLPWHQRASRLWPRALAGMMTVVAVGTYAFVRARSSEVDPSNPAIAIIDIANLGHDTASAWLEDGFAQMLASDVSRESDAEVVAPARVRDTRVRAEMPASGALGPDASLDIARRVGATLAVRGAFTHGRELYVLDLAVRDVRSGRIVRSFTVSGADPITLAADASVRIVEGSTTDATRVRFAGVETSSVMAYQYFVRALQANDAGRFQDERTELDAAIALDSGFAGAILERRVIAASDDDPALVARLDRALHRARLSPWDAQTVAIDSVVRSGEIERGEKLARSLVERFPHDPRAYDVLGEILFDEGNWPGMEDTYRRQLALDSLAIAAGTGPCAPCGAYDGLASGRSMRGDIVGAEQAAQQWVHLQPDLPHAWTVLGAVLHAAGRHDAAIDAQRRALILSGNDQVYAARLARGFIASRQLDAADAMARSWTVAMAGSPADAVVGPTVLADQFDVHVLVQRERGELQASVRDIDAYVSPDPQDNALRLEEVDALGRLGEYATAEKIFRRYIGDGAYARAAGRGFAGEHARWFCWTRALEANALAGSGDTLRLKALADSIRIIGALSYYGRDRRLYHHVLGLIAYAGQRYREAEQEFAAARWGIAGWTETVAWQARAELALNEPLVALATLRGAYDGPLDSMGRYEPRSELDYLMGVAFTMSHTPDSAAVYTGYASAALRSADPQVRVRLTSLVPHVQLAAANGVTGGM